MCTHTKSIKICAHICAIYHLDVCVHICYNKAMNSGDNRDHPVSDPHTKRYNMGEQKKSPPEQPTKANREGTARGTAIIAWASRKNKEEIT
jgi:hypothetical protein